MRRPIPALVAAAFVAVLLAHPARAVTLIRDAEIEHALTELAAPILAAAGLSPARTRILVIKDDTPNAFVTDGRHIFINSGFIMKMERAAQLQAVIAHEAAHIANGHIARRMGNMRAARTTAGLGLALAAAAAAAGSPAEAAFGIAQGTAGSAMLRFLAHTRAEEAAADQSGVRYLRAAGIDPRGAVEVLEFFRGEEVLSTRRQSAYTRTHPMSRDRIRAIEAMIAGNPAAIADPAAADYWFARSRGKLSAFLRSPSWTLRRVDGDDSPVSLMRQAVAYHRAADPQRARAAIDRLAAARPDDPFVHDLRGQILLESRDFGGAVAAYGRAVELAPDEALILGGYGRALLAAGVNARALDALEAARARDGADPRILLDLARAHAANGNAAAASLATAERYALLGRFEDADLHARRAARLLPQGSASWQRAQDVIRAAEIAAKRSN